MEDFRGNLTDAIAARDYILAGNATITIVSRATGTRYTYKVRRIKDDAEHPKFEFMKANPPKDAEPGWFVSLLSGPDNDNDFVYLGMIRNNEFRLTKKSRMTSDSGPVKAFSWVFTRLVLRHMPANIEIWHEGRCGRCGRTLTVPESIASGLGPECRGKMGL